MATGRPTKLTATLQRKICQALQSGNTRADAARGAGIGYATFARWMADGKKFQTGLFREFREAVLSAETRAADHFVKKIKAASSKHWQAAAWWLERRRPRDFGRKDRVEHTGKNGRPIRQAVTHDVAGLQAYHAAIAEFARSILAPEAPAELRSDGPAQPLAAPPADPQTGAVSSA